MDVDKNIEDNIIVIAKNKRDFFDEKNLKNNIYFLFKIILCFN